MTFFTISLPFSPVEEIEVEQLHISAETAARDVIDDGNQRLSAASPLSPMSDEDGESNCVKV